MTNGGTSHEGRSRRREEADSAAALHRPPPLVGGYPLKRIRHSSFVIFLSTDSPLPPKSPSPSPQSTAGTSPSPRGTSVSSGRDGRGCWAARCGRRGERPNSADASSRTRGGSFRG